jgi:hypothetical protein
MGIVFKMFEFHKAICFKLREKYEPAIEKACYERSMAAIRVRTTAGCRGSSRAVVSFLGH